MKIVQRIVLQVMQKCCSRSFIEPEYRELRYDRDWQFENSAT